MSKGFTTWRRLRAALPARRVVPGAVCALCLLTVLEPGPVRAGDNPSPGQGTNNPGWSADRQSPPPRAPEDQPAPEQPWKVTADKIYRFSAPPSIVAVGKVVLVREGVTSVAEIDHPKPVGGPAIKPLTITGDWVRVDTASNRIRARGHVVLDSEEEHITADLADLDMNRQTGHLKNATLYFPKRSLYLTGAEVEKISDLTYHSRDGWVTKCAPMNGAAPPWSFGWGSADITQEGFAHFTNATFRVKDVPVAYSPYVAFPTNTKRQTGLLLPEWMASSRDGFGFVVPLFINISPSQDLTLYGGDISNRGVLGGAEYRYVQEQGSKGTLALSYLNDGLQDHPGDDFKSDGIYRTNRDRYWLRGKADQNFAPDVNGKLDIDLVSDQDYLQEFPDGELGYDQNSIAIANEFGRGFDAKSTHARTSTAQLTKIWPSMTMSGEMRMIQDPTDIHSTSHPWALPGLSFAGARPLFPSPIAGGKLGEMLAATDLTWETGYVDYWRQTGVKEQRLDLHPVLKAPLPVSRYLETAASVGLRQTTYQVDSNGVDSPDYASGLKNRTLSDASLATAAPFLRDFNFNGSWLKEMTHIVRPGLSYNYVPGVDQSRLPAIDATDQVPSQNLITYELRNDFDVVGANGHAWNFGYARLSQSYDLGETRQDLSPPDAAGHKQTNPVLDSWMRPLENLQLLYKASWDVHGGGTGYYQLGASYNTSRGDAISVEHLYDPSQLIDQLNLTASVRLTHTLQAQALIDHSLQINQTSNASLRLLYNPACWGMILQATTTPDNSYRVALLFSLDGVGNIMGLSQTLSSLGGSRGNLTP